MRDQKDNVPSHSDQQDSEALKGRQTIGGARSDRGPRKGAERVFGVASEAPVKGSPGQPSPGGAADHRRGAKRSEAPVKGSPGQPSPGGAADHSRHNLSGSQCFFNNASNSSHAVV